LSRETDQNIRSRPEQRCVLAFLCWLPIFLSVITSLSGCSPSAQPVNWKNIAKADIDLVADAHLEEMDHLMAVLMVKLYKRNPRELDKVSNETINSRLNSLFGNQTTLEFTELEYKRGVDALNQTFDPGFTGDRVFTMMTGLVSMVHHSYNWRDEFFMLDTLDQQKLYNSARNIEILVWRLSNKRNVDGELFLLTNSGVEEEVNLSYERLFGKMIALQDMMARITADKMNRTINLMVHGVAKAAFLPVGI
jgi:hypothetical protein